MQVKGERGKWKGGEMQLSANSLELRTRTKSGKFTRINDHPAVCGMKGDCLPFDLTIKPVNQ
jgi:hypothetical protein